jgi:hypothetical protein
MSSEFFLCLSSDYKKNEVLQIASPTSLEQCKYTNQTIKQHFKRSKQLIKFLTFFVNPITFDHYYQKYFFILSAES